MSMQNKIKHTAEVLAGKAKEAIGKVSGNEQLRIEGKLEQGKGNLKRAGDKVKDAGKSVWEK
ncbi:MAG: CsbD family protein [Pseudonocardiaceae bacterium]